MHDGSCAPFEVEHTPGDNDLWDIPADETWRVPEQQPIIGWRQATCIIWREKLVSIGWFDPTDWTVPEAECDPYRFARTQLAGSYHYGGGCNSAPNPQCQCGYRIVRHVADLTPLTRYSWGAKPIRHTGSVRSLNFGWATKHDAPPDGECTAVFTIVEAAAWGKVTAAQFRTYNDPPHTLRAQHLQLTGQVIVPDDDTATHLAHAGMTPTIIPTLLYAHEPTQCASINTTFTLFKDPA